MKKFSKVLEALDTGKNIIDNPINDVSKIITDIVLFNDDQTQTGKYKALWDTGATNTLISKKVVNALKLETVGKSKVSSIHKTENSNMYKLAIQLPNHDKIIIALVSTYDNDETDVIIGMDIIREGEMKLDRGKLNFKINF